MCETLDVIYKRRSVRKYKPEPVSDEDLLKIMKAGQLAPSGWNKQPWHFIIVRDPELKEQLSQWKWTRFIKETPVAIVGCGRPDKSPEFWQIDVSIALQNMVIAATALGLATCWIGDFEEEKVKEILEIPEEYRVVCIVTVGYGAETPKMPRKKPLELIFSENKFGKKLK